MTGYLLDDTLFDRDMVRGHKQITDIYLLGLAVRHGGRLATFDRSIPREAVKTRDSACLEVLR